MNPTPLPQPEVIALERHADGSLRAHSERRSSQDELLDEVKAMRQQMRDITARQEVCNELLHALVRQVNRVIGGAEVFHVRTGDF